MVSSSKLELPDLITWAITNKLHRKLAGFKKHHFWLGNAAVEFKDLSNYLRGEKQEVGNHNAAWAAQTGKGLLFFSKLASEKTPAGIINLVGQSKSTL